MGLDRGYSALRAQAAWVRRTRSDEESEHDYDADSKECDDHGTDDTWTTITAGTRVLKPHQSISEQGNPNGRRRTATEERVVASVSVDRAQLLQSGGPGRHLFTLSTRTVRNDLPLR